MRTRNTKTNRSRTNRDYSLVVLIIIVIVVLASAIVINQSHPSPSNQPAGLSVDSGDQKINWDRYRPVDVELSETLNISRSGIYHLTGTLNNGLIVIDAGDEGEVKLVLDNATINNDAGPAILCRSADDLVISLTGENTVSDGELYAADYDEDIKGAIYSKADLTFEGDGELTVKANFADGIVSKDDLKFTDGVYLITAKDDGIRGKDSVYIRNGSFDINSGADAIKSTNELDSRKGFVIVENGNLDIVAGAKGIKAIKSILLYGGNYNIESEDDAIHSNNYIGITSGKMVINSGDDGIHADEEMIVDGGEILIEKSYEGIEARKITINNGLVSIMSIDDGINAGGLSEGQTRAEDKVDQDCVVTINGGEINIVASGDGIDSNGSLTFNGGTTIIDGPTSNGNGALDAGTKIIITNGEVIAIGSSMMAGSFDESSSVNNLSINLSKSYSSNAKITIKDSDDNIVVSHIAKKSFSHIVIASSKLENEKSYSLYIDNSLISTFTVLNTKTVVGNGNNGRQ